MVISMCLNIDLSFQFVLNRMICPGHSSVLFGRKVSSAQNISWLMTITFFAMLLDLAILLNSTGIVDELHARTETRRQPKSVNVSRSWFLVESSWL
jgi:hypothetical protein